MKFFRKAVFTLVVLVIGIVIFNPPRIAGTIKSIRGSEAGYIGGIQTKLNYDFSGDHLKIVCVYDSNQSAPVFHPGGDSNTYECRNGDASKNIRLRYFSVQATGKIVDKHSYTVRYECAGVDSETGKPTGPLSGSNGSNCGSPGTWLQNARGTIQISWVRCVYRFVFGNGCFS